MLKRERYISCPGETERIIYSPVVQKDGGLTVEPSGKQNIPEFINSFAESTDISVILARVQNGDVSALSQGFPMFGDFTEMPKTFAEVLQIQIDAKNAFDKLSVEQKRQFDNDFNKFLVQAGSEDWMDKIYGRQPAAIDIVPDVKESEVTE